MKKFLLGTLAVLGVGFAALPSYALDVVKDSTGSIYVTGLTPSSSTEFVFSGVTQTKSVVANGCGAITLSGNANAPLPSQVTVGGNAIDIATLPTQLMPTCSGGVWNVTPTGNFKTSTNKVVILGQTANTAIQVNYSGSTARRATSNLCGIARIRPSASFTSSGPFTITGDTGTYDFATLTLAANPDICRNGIRYVAQ